ncbi:MAG: hypothetical protein JW883_10375 [Deltaproteobacteria bacterium]|nr:hypothetical protein [Deltaproteobacteria bacterium]
MTMNLKQFKEKLLVYGADVHAWPQDIRQTGLKSLENSAELRALLADEERFELVLKTRKYEEPSSDLAERIISASQPKRKKVRRSLGGFFSGLLWEFSLSKRAVTAVSVSLVLVLIIGFAIGFSNPMGSVSTEQYQTDLQEPLYYEGNVL